MVRSVPKRFTATFKVTLKHLPYKDIATPIQERIDDLKDIILDGMGFPDSIEVEVEHVEDWSE